MDELKGLKDALAGPAEVPYTITELQLIKRLSAPLVAVAEAAERLSAVQTRWCNGDEVDTGEAWEHLDATLTALKEAAGKGEK